MKRENTVVSEITVYNESEITKLAKKDVAAKEAGETREKGKIRERITFLSGLDVRTVADPSTETMRNACDAAIAAIKPIREAHLEELKAEGKKGKDSPLWRGFRYWEKSINWQRSKVRTEEEKTAMFDANQEKKAAKEKEIIQAAIDAGEVVLPESMLETSACGVEEALFSLSITAQANGWDAERFTKAAAACFKVS